MKSTSPLASSPMPTDSVRTEVGIIDSVDGAAVTSESLPDRKERILSAAADLVASKGYHAVSVADIGAAAGVTGPAIYRHFRGKPAVLTALFDRAIDQLVAEAHSIAGRDDDVAAALSSMVDGQVRFVVEDRVLAQVYYTEINSLPDDDRRRLRRKQRLYLEEWVHLLSEVRPDLDELEVRSTVHAAIGAIQSALFHRVDLPEARLRLALARAAHNVLRSP